MVDRPLLRCSPPLYSTAGPCGSTSFGMVVLSPAVPPTTGRIAAQQAPSASEVRRCAFLVSSAPSSAWLDYPAGSHEGRILRSWRPSITRMDARSASAVSERRLGAGL